jgi:hypothetical protein
LVALYRANASDFELFSSTLPQWSEALIETMALEAATDLATIITAFEEHLEPGFPFTYLDTLARLLGLIYRTTRENAVRQAALQTLLRIGARYDEIDMGKEFAALAGRARNPRALRPVAEALRDQLDTLLWAGQYLTNANVSQAVHTALEELGIFLVDLGDSKSEARFGLKGWGDAKTWVTFPKSPRDDRSLRYQVLGAENSLTFSDVPEATYRLSAEVVAGECDDSFEILVDEEVVLTYRHTPERIPTVKRHDVEIDHVRSNNHSLVVTFRNLASDDCGCAGVYHVLLQQLSRQVG